MPRIVRGALAAGDLDRRQGVDDPEARGATPTRRRKQGAQVMLFQELFYGPYFCQVQDAQYYSYTELHPRRPDDEAHAGPRQADRAWSSSCRCTRRTRQASGHLLQHRGGHRRRREVPRQVPQDAHPARQGLLGEVLLPARATSATRCSRRPSARSASTSATTATSPRAPGRSASTAPRWCSSRRATSRGLSEYLWRDRAGQPRASPTATSSGRSTGSASSPTRRRRLLRPELLRATRAASSSATSAAPTTRSCSSGTWTST